jgi:hypothetical protein
LATWSPTPVKIAERPSTGIERTKTPAHADQLDRQGQRRRRQRRGYLQRSGTVTLTNSDLTSNTASGNGGGIYNDGDFGTATVTFTDTSAQTGTSVDHNTAASGGGIYNEGAGATITLDNSSAVSRNTATATDGGGGIFNNGGTLIGAVAPPAPGANVKNNTPDNIVG